MENPSLTDSIDDPPLDVPDTHTPQSHPQRSKTTTGLPLAPTVAWAGGWGMATCLPGLLCSTQLLHLFSKCQSLFAQPQRLLHGHRSIFDLLLQCSVTHHKSTRLHRTDGTPPGSRGGGYLCPAHTPPAATPYQIPQARCFTPNSTEHSNTVFGNRTNIFVFAALSHEVGGRRTVVGRYRKRVGGILGREGESLCRAPRARSAASTPATQGGL